MLLIFRISRLFIRFSLFAPAFFLFLSCSGSPPKIEEIRYRLMAFNDREKDRVYEYLVLGVRAADEDGQDDLESLSLIHDEEELYWQFDQDEWVVREFRQQSWLVAETILAGKEFLPRGVYRILVRDFSGSLAERSFSLTAPEEPPPEFPALALEDGGLVLSSAGNESILMVKSAAGVLLGSFVLKKGRNSRQLILANAQITDQAKDLYLYTQGPSAGISLLSGPWAASDFLFSLGNAPGDTSAAD
jgi:hypothetical protein